MIKICMPQIENRNDNITRVVCNIEIDDDVKSVWFDVEKKYEKYLSVDRADAYLIGMLHYALSNHHNIKCELPVSEELLYNIKKILIPSLVNHSKNFRTITIEAKTISNYNMGQYVGTGCSCGIDSMSAIYNHLKTEYKSLDLTHLCINNVGAFNDCYKEYGQEKVKSERYEITEKVAKEIGLDLIKTDSNFGEVIHQRHLFTHTYSSIFAVYMLQKMWKVYYYASSGIDFSGFTLEDNDIHDCAHYELLSLQCFSQSNIKVYSEGGEKTRFEKTKDIVDFKVANNYLHVCLRKSYNCNVCSKCRRTLVTLDLLNKLNNFENVFDIDYYKKHKKNYYRWLAIQHYKKDLMNEPVYQEMKKRKEFKKQTILCREENFIKELIKRIVPKRIKSIIKGK